MRDERGRLRKEKKMKANTTITHIHTRTKTHYVYTHRTQLDTRSLVVKLAAASKSKRQTMR